MPRWNRFLATISASINVSIYDGLEHDMLSARAYRENWKLRIWIDRLFFWQTDHCLHSHLRQVYRRQFGVTDGDPKP